MTGRLDGKRVAILAANGFEQDELVVPRRALDEAGATTVLVSPEDGQVRGWKHTDWGDELRVDLPLEQAKADDFDALLLPGGVMNPDHLRRDPRAVAFARGFVEAGKPIAAICHGPWLLVEADAVRGRRTTSFASIRTDLVNAGAEWIDEPVVVDDGLVTSRQPSDIPAFNAKMIEEFAEGPHPVHASGRGDEPGWEASSSLL